MIKIKSHLMTKYPYLYKKKRYKNMTLKVEFSKAYSNEISSNLIKI